VSRLKCLLVGGSVATIGACDVTGPEQALPLAGTWTMQIVAFADSGFDAGTPLWTKSCEGSQPFTVVPASADTSSFLAAGVGGVLCAVHDASTGAVDVDSTFAGMFKGTRSGDTLTFGWEELLPGVVFTGTLTGAGVWEGAIVEQYSLVHLSTGTEYRRRGSGTWTIKMQPPPLASTWTIQIVAFADSAFDNGTPTWIETCGGSQLITLVPTAADTSSFLAAGVGGVLCHVRYPLTGGAFVDSSFAGMFRGTKSGDTLTLDWGEGPGRTVLTGTLTGTGVLDGVIDDYYSEASGTGYIRRGSGTWTMKK
jgi:hypothetical protein